MSLITAILPTLAPIRLPGAMARARDALGGQP